MNAPATRYTDRDVQEYPDLLAQAVDYVRNYRGEFDYLIAARDLCNATGTLTVAVARGVLNCMRSDPRVAASLQPPVQWPDLRPSYTSWKRNLAIVEDEDDDDEEEENSDLIAQAADYVRKRPFALNVKWKKMILSSIHASAQKYHYLDPIRSEVRYYPAVQEYITRVYAECGWRPSGNAYELLDTPPECRRECKQCIERRVLP